MKQQPHPMKGDPKATQEAAEKLLGQLGDMSMSDVQAIQIGLILHKPAKQKAEKPEPTDDESEGEDE